MNVSHVLINNDVYQIVAARGSGSGSGSGHMGIAMALAGLPEAIPMFIFPWMLKKKDSGFWFRLSGVFFTLKALGTDVSSMRKRTQKEVIEMVLDFAEKKECVRREGV